MPSLNEIARGFLDAVKDQGIKAQGAAKDAIDAASNMSYQLGQSALNKTFDVATAPGVPGRVGRAVFQTGEALAPALRAVGGGSMARGTGNALALGTAATAAGIGAAALMARKKRMAGQAMAPENTVY